MWGGGGVGEGWGGAGRKNRTCAHVHASHADAAHPATPFARRLTKTSCGDATGGQVASAPVCWWRPRADGARGGQAMDARPCACASDVSMQEASQGVRRARRVHGRSQAAAERAPAEECRGSWLGELVYKVYSGLRARALEPLSR